MTLDETADLLRTIRAICPAQAQDEFTPEAWNLVLDDIAMPDAMAAVRRIARSTDTKPLWIDPRQILNEVRRVRTARLDATPTSGAPPTQPPTASGSKPPASTSPAAMPLSPQP